MTLAGRTLIVTADVISAAAEEGMSELLTSAAAGLRVSRLADRLESALRGVGVSMDLHDLEELVEEGLLVGAEVFRPLPTNTRARIRSLLYEIINTMPAGESASFQEQLKAAGFIPNEAAIRALATELGTIAAGRLKLFAELILLRIAERLLAELMEVIDAIAAQVSQWIGQLGALIDQLRQDIDRLLSEAAALLQQAEDALADAFDRTLLLLQTLGNASGRNAFLDQVEDVVYHLAKPLLEDDLVYAILPSDQKRLARESVRDVIRTLARNGIVDTILDSIGDCANDVDGFFADVRTFDPHDGLVSGILDLLLNRIGRRVREVAGGKEGFSIGITIAWSVDYWTYDLFRGKWVKHTNHFDQRIELARVHWDLDGLLPLLRRAVYSLTFVEKQLNDIANALLSAINFERQAAVKHAVRNLKQADRDAATHTQNESSCIPSRIEIVEPTQSALYEGPITVRVRLPDTPASFVGAGASEEQRIYLWLNSEEIPCGEFTVNNVQDRVVTPVIQPGQALGRWVPASITMQPLPATMALTTGVSAALRRAPARAPEKGRAPGIGRPLPGVGKPVGAKPLPPPIVGIEITVPLAADRLEDGTNTFVVAVVNGRGQRVTKSVSFLASAPLRVKEKIRQPRLEDILGRSHAKPPVKVAKKALVTPAAVRKQRLKLAKERIATRAVRFPELEEPR
jgi:hypothetical protein